MTRRVIHVDSVIVRSPTGLVPEAPRLREAVATAVRRRERGPVQHEARERGPVRHEPRERTVPVVRIDLPAGAVEDAVARAIAGAVAASIGPNRRRR
jgi:hypothetical protein